MKVRIEFIEPVLGTLAANKEVAEDFVVNKNPKGAQQDELDAVDRIDVEKELEKITTVFPRNEEGQPFIWDYQVKGHFKGACEAMIHGDCFTKEELKKLRLTQYLYKKTIDQLLFVAPRRMVLCLPNGDPLGFCERPLRGQTMRGERIALARSEQAPIGTTFECIIEVLNKNLAPFIEVWLTHGKLSGFLQWRNSGMGRFIWKEIK